MQARQLAIVIDAADPDLRDLSVAAMGYEPFGAAEIDTETNRLLALGATQVSDRIDEVGTSWILLADPEGNQFCPEPEPIGEPRPIVTGHLSGMKRSGATCPLNALVSDT
jgi:hypothetical protein